MSKGEQAKELFLSGYNCAQAVFCVFAKELGIDNETALKLSACFGGGLGRQREVCGAVSAMCMVLSLKHAPKDPTDHKEKTVFYTHIQEICNKFKEENGSIICRELLGLSESSSSPIPDKRTPQYYAKRPCVDKVKSAVDILEKYFNQEK